MPTQLPLSGRRSREPIFNLPAVVTVMVVLMMAIHGIRLLQPEETDDLILGLFAFAPDRYFHEATDDPEWPGGVAAAIWSPFTYALLHNDLLHLISNCTVFAALGNVLARRMTTAAFLSFCVLMAPVSVVGELLIAVYQPGPVIGVSGVICAMLGALARFIFPPPEPAAAEAPGRAELQAPTDVLDKADERLITASRVEPDADRAVPRRRPEIGPVLETLRRPKVIQFILGFAVLNILLVVAAPVLVGGGAGVAWMVHVTGFVAGFLLYPWFDGAHGR